MSARWTPGMLTMMLMASASACAISGPESDEAAIVDDAGRTPPDGARPEPIINGAEATGYPSAAIVNMRKGNLHVSSCSGAVIAPRIVLTAGHCAVGNFDNWDVLAPYAGGQSAHATQALVYDYTSTSGFVDPNRHDVALLVLSSDIALTSYPEIATSPVAAGTLVRNIGRINNGVMNYQRLFVSQPIGVSNGSSKGYPFDYAATEVIQSGDSGGPVVLSGVLPHKIVAVNSGAGGGTELLARVDLLHSWISDQIAAHGGSAPPPPPPPQGGTCAHDSCEEGAKLVASCDPCVQQICAQDPYCCSNSWDGQCVGEVASVCGSSCTAPPPPPPPEPEPDPTDPCGGITFEGQCDGQVLSWCGNAQLTTVNCAASGKSCGWDSTNNYYDCL